MSLLLDALKRAEQEKLARDPEAAPRAAAPAPRAVPAVAAPSLELQPIGGSAAGNAPARPESPAHAAQNVFQAKAAGTAPEARSRGMVWATVGAIVVVLIAASAYVWYSVSALTPQSQPVPRPRPAPVAAPASAEPLPATASPLGGGFIPLAPAPRSALPEPERAPAPGVPSAPRTASLAVAAAPVSSPAQLAEALRRDAAEVTAPAPLRLDRSPDEPRRVPPQVANAYESLRQGDLAAARRGYEAALAADPANIDAHLGLATIAARSAGRASAASHYRRALDLDPRNATALAGLAALADLSRPEALEAQLRADLERDPQAGALHFTLGNLYASQARWHEAQAAYFEAHRIEPAAADVAFNLAVSLDHLGQASAAASFYRRALDNAHGQATQFDPAVAARRLAELR